jgi:hypothetical protein
MTTRPDRRSTARAPARDASLPVRRHPFGRRSRIMRQGGTYRAGIRATQAASPAASTAATAKTAP